MPVQASRDESRLADVHTKKCSLITAHHRRSIINIEILVLFPGVLRPGNIHPAIRVPRLCKPGPEIHYVSSDHRIRFHSRYIEQ